MDPLHLYMQCVKTVTCQLEFHLGMRTKLHGAKCNLWADDNQGCIALAQHSFQCAICQHGPSKMVCAECFSLDVTVELTSAGGLGGWADSIDT